MIRNRHKQEHLQQTSKDLKTLSSQFKPLSLEQLNNLSGGCCDYIGNSPVKGGLVRQKSISSDFNFIGDPTTRRI
ncbi:MAG: hypothetical protein QNJ51_13005 [Calothrix sp. MO_167.B12]|nr:hypothetical protein [Calothrix sp. MO_167.B12]